LFMVRLPAALPRGSGQRARAPVVGTACTVTAPRLGERAPRGLSGVLAGGLVVLAIAVCLAQWLAGTSGRAGPGLAAVAGHGLAAAAAVALQLAADRRGGRGAALASYSILLLTACVLWFGWWA
jgi:hypothetical protein